jgi:DNA processing protein
MTSRSDWGAWLALRMVRGIGNALGQSLVRAFGSPREVFSASQHALECAGLRREVARAVRNFDQWNPVEEQLARLNAIGGSIVTWLDPTYPELLRHVHDPPLFLFVCGEFLKEDALAVAVVGSRAASAYALHMACEISGELARYGITVVSGLARGVDAEAHKGALASGGRTIAVLGCGIDVVYPSEHRRLQAQIAQRGAVVSELLLGTQPDAENFPGRNRIISGLSLGTLVVEATEKSGSLITAEYAADQGREVFAIPGTVGAHNRGTHRLIRQGAVLTESAEDIIAEVAPQLLGRGKQVVQPQLEAAESAVLAAVDDSSVHVDTIIARSGLPSGKVLEALLGLELRGLIRQLPGKRFVRSGCEARRGPLGG